MRPMFSFMGSKWRSAKFYGPPRTGLIIEPFAGGACYSLYWEHPRVVLYEKDTIIAGIWNYLIKVKQSEVLSLPLDFDSTDDLKIPIEAKWLIGFWITKGSVHPNKTRSAWARQYNNNRDCKVWGAPVRSRIAQQLHKIRGWTIFHKDGLMADNVYADWFIDPPYEKAGKRYRSHDVNYANLASFCKTRLGYVTVCENIGADWLPFDGFRTLQGTNGCGRSGVTYEAVYRISNPKWTWSDDRP